MNITDILKANGIEDEVVQAILAAMKENRIYTASEENLDIRYGKLKQDHDGVSKQLTEANATIDALKKSTKGQEEAQQKIAEYEQQVTHLNQQLLDEKWRNRARIGLMQAGADDIDYVLYKLEEGMAKEGKERRLTEAEEIDGWADLLKTVQTQLPQRFANGDDGDDGYHVLNPNRLRDNDNSDQSVTRERFASMGYEERMALKTKNEKLYQQMIR
ncbi:MAG: phage scaffolding protein [Clostridia bacterium]|nr:phage scaffolding protein [Clostridia bacterium]